MNKTSRFRGINLVVQKARNKTTKSLVWCYLPCI